MLLRKDIPLDQFTIQVSPPETRHNSVCVNIYEDGKVNMNGKLSQELGGKRLSITFTPGCKYICFREEEEPSGIRFPKNGSCILFSCRDLLSKNRFHFPVKYEMWYSELYHAWQGAYIENPTKPSSKERRNVKRN